MSILLPEYSTSVLIVIIILSIEFFVGYLLIKNYRSVWLSWIFPIASVTLVHLLFLKEAAGFRMLALILVLLTGMKVVMAAHYPNLKFSFGKWLMYCFTWVGMSPELFFKTKSSPDYTLLYRGGTYLIMGVSIILGILFIVKPASIPTGINYYILSVSILIAFSQILHFGLLNISAFFLQLFKYPTYSLFRAPLQAESLRDFWGKRWNLAFTEMTSVTVYRPLLKVVNEKPAMLFSFLFSGLLHEVALSLPVNSGYGLPLLYFFIQLCLTILEREIFKNKKPGTIWVIGCLLIPLPILFHPAIMRGVFWQVIL